MGNQRVCSKLHNYVWYTNVIMIKKLLILIGLIITFNSYSQTVNSPAATAYPQSTANQQVSGFSVSGFNSTATLLVTVGLVNPPSGTTLRLNTTSGVTASTGYSLASNFTRISFTGTQANINTVLASLRLNTGSIPGNVYIAVTATENPRRAYIPEEYVRIGASIASPSSAKSAISSK